ncbi:MAG: SDR family NAD(P)-dependent oxidoreductase [Hyphomonadaceae bacterium]|nr:SDR family NAD(P)-dependent oxidoreductase [Hyphomonadaceae bacterium]
MSGLASLRPNYQAAVFGASGGIGAALTRLLAADENCACVHAGARGGLVTSPKIAPFHFDLTDEPSIDAAAAQISSRAGEVELVIVATGILHHGAMRPEKSFRALDPTFLAESYAINAIGPALIAKHMLPLLPRDRKSVFAALSARVGSISDNRLGGWHAYRAAKAALNQLIRTCAIELAVKNKPAVCVTLHPGTVDTRLSQPFQANVRADHLFTPEYSAGRLLQVIDGLTHAQSGQFFAWDGEQIDF